MRCQVARTLLPGSSTRGAGLATEPSSEPSDEEMLQAVERYLSGQGRTVRLVVPRTAELSRQPLLDFRIERRYEKRRGGLPGRLPGKKLKQVSRRPSYIDLDTHPVEVPPGFAQSPQVELVLAGSIAEVLCPDCAAGKQDCEGCGGRGRIKCVKYVECTGCGGGGDACWECGGTGRPPVGPRNRRRPTNAQVMRVMCNRCGLPDAACPTCLGRKEMNCPACGAQGHRACDTCKGTKHVRHTQCDGTGFFTTWTGAVVTHPVDSDRERNRLPYTSGGRRVAPSAGARSP